MKTTKAIVLGSGVIMPAGTDLSFADGAANFNGEPIQLSQLPYNACEYEMNSELNPAVWENEQMKPEVRTKLLDVANDFYASTGFTAPILDIILSGSMANYNYHDKSDLDVHIVIDFAQQNPDTELVKNAANALKWKWNMQHSITVAGHDVELYIQDCNEEHVASGVYSLMNDSWLTKPTIKTINTSESDVQAKVQSIMADTDDLERRINDENNEQDLQELLVELDELRYRVLHLRKDAFANGEDEFAVGNLAFKELRNNGTIEKLLKLENALYDKIHSI
jgi:hypothetical protein